MGVLDWFRRSESSPSGGRVPRNSAGHHPVVRTQQVQQRPPGQPGYWVPPGQLVSVGGYTIPGGMLYVGHSLLASNGMPEPALVDPTLPVNHRSPDWNGAGLDYWPSYATIPPGSRAAYQAWLADGRRFPKAPIGYVFLFFYGLERRILVDLPRDPAAKGEISAIAAEISRLLSVYSNRSFQSYAGEFLNLLEALDPSALVTVPTRPLVLSEQRWPVPMALRRGLGAFAAGRIPVPPDWARAWAWYHPTVPQRTAAVRCGKEFDELFAVRYAQRCGKGLVVAPGRGGLEVAYRPASGALRDAQPVVRTGLPDVLELPGPSRVLSELTEAVTEELAAYSRWLGRHPDGRGSLPAAALLPAELVDDQVGEVAALRQWAIGQLGEASSAVIDTAELVVQWPTAIPGKMSKAEFVALATLLDRCGLGVEPDVRFGGPVPTTGSVVLFRDTPGAPRVADPGYAAATTLLHLAVAVSAADGQVSIDEQRHLVDHLDTALHLSAAEQTRLRAHLRWLIAQGVKLTGLTRRLGALTPAQRQAIGDFLVGVAAIDGVIDHGEVTVLTKIYGLLGLDSRALHSQLHQRATRQESPARSQPSGSAPTPADAPVTVRSADPVPTGFVIPAPPAIVPDVGKASTVHTPSTVSATDAGKAPESSPSDVDLDHEAIAVKRAETAEVLRLLLTVFADDEPNPPVPEPEPVAPRSQTTPVIAGLDPVHGRLLADLLTRSSWSRTEFEELAQRHGVMPSGALDVLNEAALDATGDLIVEGDDDLIINDDIREELCRA